MKTWLKWAALGCLALLLLALPAVYFGGRMALEHYLGKGLAIGEGQVRFSQPRFSRGLSLVADSVAYTAPGLGMRGHALVLSVDLFRSLGQFSPALSLAIDTLRLVIADSGKAKAKTKADEADDAKASLDSLAFPHFSLPAHFRVTAKSLAIEDSAGPWFDASGIMLRNQGKQGLVMDIKRLGGRPMGKLSLAWQAEANWESDSLQVTASMLTLLAGVSPAAKSMPGDGFQARIVLPKSQLLRGHIHVTGTIASSRPYAKAFALPSTLPLLEGASLDLRAGKGIGLGIKLKLQGLVSGFPKNAPYRLTPQQVALALDFSDTAGTWSVTSQGQAGEDLALKGSLNVTQRDSLDNPVYLARHLQAKAGGKVQGIPLWVGGKRIMLRATLDAPLLGPDAVTLDLVTGDDSRISLALRRGNKEENRAWSGNFHADVKSQEGWVRAFVDTAIAFSALRLRGEVRGNDVQAITDCLALRAYGLSADSLHLRHAYIRGDYALLPSLWRLGKVDWRLQGKVGLSKPGMPVEFHLDNPDYGSLDFFMPRAGLFSAQVHNLAMDQLPYKALDSLAQYRPRLSGKAAWQQKKLSGFADLAATGHYRGENLAAKIIGHWNADSLVLQKAVASLGEAHLQADALIALHGRQFYELQKLRREDYRHIALEADHFDLAKALNVALPESPLLSGVLDGRFSYSDTAGFKGLYRFLDIQPRATVDWIVLRSLALEGKGDSLIIHAMTQSEKQPLLNDSLRLALSGILEKDQDLDLRLRAGPSLGLRLQGRMQSFRDITGRLQVAGSLILPGKAGEIRDLKMTANLALPFQDFLAKAKIDADTLRGKYSAPDIPVQAFSAPLGLQAGKIHLPRLVLRAENGEELSGHLDYSLVGERILRAQLQGPNLSLRFGKEDKATMRGLRVQARADSNWLQVDADIAGLSGDYVKPPLRASAGLSGIAVTYRLPLAKRKNIPGTQDPIASLKVRAVLDTSLVRYRLRSMATLQNLFRRSPGKGKRTAKRDQAMDMQIAVETSGSGNALETDILRMEYVGDFSLRGTLPFALANGRVNSTSGQLGTRNQAYEIQNLELKWLNAPLEEGTLAMEAQKRLARDCEATTTDSCAVITRLNGPLSEIRFSYDSDCQGAYGSGADVSALIYSVRRGCFSSAFSSGGGKGYQEAALGLLEPLASQYLTAAAEKLSGKWIASAQISGLGALGADSATASQEAIAVEVLSKEVKRIRFRARSAYTPESQDASNPWDYLLALEWRPPLEHFFSSAKGKQIVSSQLKAEAALYTDRTTALEGRESEARKKLGLTYFHDFWGSWRGQAYLDESARAGEKP